MPQRRSRVPWFSWAPLATVASLAALSALWVALTPAGDQTELAGRTWQQLSLQEPELAHLVSRQLNVLGFLGAGFGLLAAVISIMPYRRGEAWAWYALWLFPITIGVAVRQLIDQYPAAYYYAALTAVAVVGLLLPLREILRRQG